MKDRNNLIGLGLFISGLLLSAGTAWLFPTCGPKSDGAWMKCHWSGQAVIGTGVVLTLLAIVYLLVSSKPFRAGLSVSAILVGMFNLAVLNGLIGLCGMADMQCRAVTQPAVTIISAIVILISAFNTAWILASERRKKVGSA